ncbi:unnamed protein product [Mytilus coruscus]|uniref:YqaJ viral recombinase domain-containing protein n=1 Tax=Mytilus coruscus TaxID=42192 RepID=A0A6J8CV84_MYTCO|nr:unnamed protein product [Mytilus coruscus]
MRNSAVHLHTIKLEPCCPPSFAFYNVQKWGDDIEIDQSFIAKFVKHTTDHTLSDEQILQVEQLTKGQSDNSFWKQIHRFKATSSNFGKIIKCSRNPDFLFKAMFYSEPHYGKENEDKAIEAYKHYMDSRGSNVQVESVGIILLKDRPVLGASLDGIVVDPSANITRGGLEVKCPYSKANFNINEACKDKTFFLKSENG